MPNSPVSPRTMKTISLKSALHLAVMMFFLFALASLRAEQLIPTRQPLVRVMDLDVGETQEIELSNGTKARVKLIDLQEKRDSLRAAVREARVRVEVNGTPILLLAGNYNLPVTVGPVQIDCSITSGYNANGEVASWGLDKAARLRLWPAGSPWIEPGTFIYPLKQRWFATATQMANEPTYVDGGDRPLVKKIYYHNDLDTGGTEGMVDVVAATDGLVVSARGELLPDYQNTPAKPRYDVVYLLDDRGWYYRYSHFQSIDAGVRLGQRVRMGQKMGVLGKEGASGGWTHLHFGIVSRQPSGKWGTQEAYAFFWQAYLNQYQPNVIAVARPHHLAVVNEVVKLDATKSWSSTGRIADYEWTFTDGTKASGAVVSRSYPKPGSYSEILKVTDTRGRVAYDFALVQIIDPLSLNDLPPTLHPTYAPTMNLKAGEKITFKVRTFRTTYGEETWNFGDGTPTISVKSDGNVKPLAKDGYAVTTHVFNRAGTYLVSVERTNDRGEKAVGRLAVEVGK